MFKTHRFHKKEFLLKLPKTVNAGTNDLRPKFLTREIVEQPEVALGMGQ